MGGGRCEEKERDKKDKWERMNEKEGIKLLKMRNRQGKVKERE